ncbi:hypothetical protein OBBRIDRAFT_825926 [Obba rivulosa]|uniref:Reverse transcriptase n=1 Tax=Obba rivulosa TaxID=1052685 RepID=A0A8E2AT44_9APHY|nr:hypothetical protein OBBRIDRAFT_825926 [Obba rivulosa]
MYHLLRIGRGKSEVSLFSGTVREDPHELVTVGHPRLYHDLERGLADVIALHWSIVQREVLEECVDDSAKSALRLAASDVVSLSAARSRVVDRMRRAWRTQAEHKSYRGQHFVIPEAYRASLSHTAQSNPFLKRLGSDSRMFARFTRVVTGHAPVGRFRERFNLYDPTDCLCGHPVGTIQHIFCECPVWVRKWRPRSR